MTPDVTEDLRGWLLEGDPAIRWRVLGCAEERRRLATEGWAARLLAAQDASGGWGGGEYSPKWTSTTYTLLRLLWLGLAPGHPAALRGCDQLWEWHARRRVRETCIVAMLTRLIGYFQYEAAGLDDLVAYLASIQAPAEKKKAD